MNTLTKAAREALEACETALRQFTKTPSTLADSTARGNAHAALATLRAALSEAPGEEREAFEAWALSENMAVDRFHADSSYIYAPTGDAWSAWQARAMLAARPEAPTVALTVETAPLGTKAPAYIGGHWTKTLHGWKWCTGSTFPRPGGDWTGELIPPEAGKEGGA